MPGACSLRSQYEKELQRTMCMKHRMWNKHKMWNMHNMWNRDKISNTWYAPTATSRILFTYDAATSRLKYYLGDPASGTYAMRANLAVNSTVKSANEVGSSLCVCKKVPISSYGSSNQVYWDGGFNNLIVSDKALTGPQVDEFFQTGEAFTEHEYYPDLTSYWRLGEDEYPAITDSKGDSDGTLVNGAANDFVDIPSE